MSDVATSETELERSADDAASDDAMVAGDDAGDDAPVAAPKKKRKRDRTAEVVFRVAYREQLDLTALADSKANIMIHINGLILSIVLASAGLIRNREPWLQLPSAALALTALTSLVLAVLAARPKLRKPPQITVDDVRTGRANPLFFGNFGRLSEEDFVTAMREMFENSERTYLNLTRHIHGMGHVLLRKFKLLRVSYTVFLVGLLVSCMLFLLTLTASAWGSA